MNNFNLKLLTISGIAIASALLLLKTITTYGENHLHATPLINTRYHLHLNQILPNCQKTNTLVLNIQQSGIYINAGILPIKTNAKTKTPLTLTGKFKNQQLTLSGNINTAILCRNPNFQNNQLQPITIQMSQLTQEYIPGQIKINNIPQTLEFIALPKANKKTISQLQNH